MYKKINKRYLGLEYSKLIWFFNTLNADLIRKQGAIYSVLIF